MLERSATAYLFVGARSAPDHELVRGSLRPGSADPSRDVAPALLARCVSGPACTTERDLLPGPAQAVASSGARRPRLLLVDDDRLLRSAFARLLRGHFEVSCAEHADAALALVTQGPAFDLVLCDQQLGETIQGSDLFATLGQVSSRLQPRFVLMSGASLPPGLLPSWVPVLLKPFDGVQLLARLQDALRRAGNAGARPGPSAANA